MSASGSRPSAPPVAGTGAPTPRRSRGCRCARRAIDGRTSAARRAHRGSTSASISSLARAVPVREPLSVRQRRTTDARSNSSGRAVATTSSGTSAARRDQMLEEREECVVGPVQVLEDEDERARSARSSRNRGQAAKFSLPRGLRRARGRAGPAGDAGTTGGPDPSGRTCSSLAATRRRGRRSRGCRRAP